DLSEMILKSAPCWRAVARHWAVGSRNGKDRLRLRTEQHMIELSIHVNATPEAVWQHIPAVDIASFRHPPYLVMLGIPKPLRAEVVAPGVGGTRTAFFTHQRTFVQTITAWQPYEWYAFTF